MGRALIVFLPLSPESEHAVHKPWPRDCLLALDWLGGLFDSHLLLHLPRASPAWSAGMKEQVGNQPCPPAAPSIGKESDTGRGHCK